MHKKMAFTIIIIMLARLINTPTLSFVGGVYQQRQYRKDHHKLLNNYTVKIKTADAEEAAALETLLPLEILLTLETLQSLL